jgi:hypothetical protein
MSGRLLLMIAFEEVAAPIVAIGWYCPDIMILRTKDQTCLKSGTIRKTSYLRHLFYQEAEKKLGGYV